MLVRGKLAQPSVSEEKLVQLSVCEEASTAKCECAEKLVQPSVSVRRN